MVQRQDLNLQKPINKKIFKQKLNVFLLMVNDWDFDCKESQMLLFEKANIDREIEKK